MLKVILPERNNSVSHNCSEQLLMSRKDSVYEFKLKIKDFSVYLFWFWSMDSDDTYLTRGSHFVHLRMES